MTYVSILGMGKMGGAMAIRLASTGHSVALWNRSIDKAHEVAAEIRKANAEADVVVAATAGEAVAKADKNVIMVLSTMTTTAVMMESLRAENVLDGKVLVNLTSGNPSEGREIDELAKTLGVATYIDGAYSGPPAKVLAGAGILFLSGPEAVTDVLSEEVLKDLGKPVFSGAIGASRALDYAVVDMFMANYLFYTSNLAMLEKEGVDPELAISCIKDRLATVPAILEVFRKRQSSREPEVYSTNPIATVDTWRNFLLGRVPYQQENGMSSVVPEFVGGLLTELSNEGHGADDMSRLQEKIRYKSS